MVLYGELERRGMKAVDQSSQFKQWSLTYNTRITYLICGVEITIYEINLDIM